MSAKRPPSLPAASAGSGSGQLWPSGGGCVCVCCETRGARPARGSEVSAELSVEKLQPGGGGGGGLGEAAAPLSPLPLLLGLLVSGMVARARKEFSFLPCEALGLMGVGG